MQLARYVQCGGHLARVQVSWGYCGITGGTEVLGYHRGALRYWGITGGTEVCGGGAQGLGGESSASCINYPGKKPARTQNYQL